MMLEPYGSNIINLSSINHLTNTLYIIILVTLKGCDIYGHCNRL